MFFDASIVPTTVIEGVLRWLTSLENRNDEIFLQAPTRPVAEPPDGISLACLISDHGSPMNGPRRGRRLPLVVSSSPQNVSINHQLSFHTFPVLPFSPTSRTCNCQTGVRHDFSVGKCFVSSWRSLLRRTTRIDIDVTPRT